MNQIRINGHWLAVGSARFNAPMHDLLSASVEKGEGQLSADGALIVQTGKFTGRSPKDKHIVRQPDSAGDIWWDGNNEMSEAHFAQLRADLIAYLGDKPVEVQDLVGGADPSQYVNIRLIAEYTWHALFLQHLLRKPDPAQAKQYQAEYTIVNAPGFRADPERHGCKSDTVVAVNFSEKLILIGGTEYAGENKKSAFTILNHVYPERGILPMHCSANHAPDNPNETAIFFGLSGTGKTTLSSAPNRILIGDDEHAWSDDGVFNIEGGCYAKTINLDAASEPEIWQAVHTPGTVLENVGYDAATGELDLTDSSLTENTRAAYSMEVLSNASPTARGGTPRNVFLLTCDAYGVTPPISRLTAEQARVLFLLGFTSKVAGTERGVSAPSPTFSTCFGAPFLTRQPQVYADMFEERIAQSDARVWLLNTGWTGGGAADGTRMPIGATRALLDAALSGELDNLAYRTDPTWGIDVPVTGPDAACAYLDPKATWADADKFDESASVLRAEIAAEMQRLGLSDDAFANR